MFIVACSIVAGSCGDGRRQTVPTQDREGVAEAKSHDEVAIDAVEPAAELAPTSPVNEWLRLAFVGDISFAWRELPRSGDPAKDDNPFVPLRPTLSRADLTFGNMEGIFADRDPRLARKHHNLWAPPVWADTFDDSGIDVLSMANNHAMDGDAASLLFTRELLESKGLAVLGAGRDADEAFAPLIVERPQGCVAVLAATTGVNPTRGTQKGAAVAVYREEADRRRFHDLVRETADRCPLMIVYFHWGPEKRPKPTPYVRTIARRLVDDGAQLVIGHHPHVLQGIEFRGDGVIAYSLGNFVFSRATWVAGMTGVLELDLTWRAGEQPSLESVRLVPAVIDRRSFTPEPPTRRHRERVFRRMREVSEPFGTRVELGDDGLIHFTPKSRR